MIDVLPKSGFLIKHPTVSYKRLQYGLVCGPEHGVYYRGKIPPSGIIALPQHWVKLVDEKSITAHLTGNSQIDIPYVVSIRDNKVTVGNASLIGKSMSMMGMRWLIGGFFVINATRSDVGLLVTEL